MLVAITSIREGAIVTLTLLIKLMMKFDNFLLQFSNISFSKSNLLEFRPCLHNRLKCVRTICNIIKNIDHNFLDDILPLYPYYENLKIGQWTCLIQLPMQPLNLSLLATALEVSKPIMRKNKSQWTT